jgi:hypothetical protein
MDNYLTQSEANGEFPSRRVAVVMLLLNLFGYGINMTILESASAHKSEIWVGFMSLWIFSWCALAVWVFRKKHKGQNRHGLISD